MPLLLGSQAGSAFRSRSLVRLQSGHEDRFLGMKRNQAKRSESQVDFIAHREEPCS
jgi:hypothetical protein